MTKRLCYVVFGPGRVGTNIAAWLRDLGHKVALISHAEADRDPEKCRRLIGGADVVAAALPDGALNQWMSDWRAFVVGKAVVHFSGALLIDGAWSYHPLYSFPKSVLPAGRMNGVAFAREEKAAPLAETFPGARNAEFAVRDHDRAYYHALAVLSGNFAAHLWNETATGFDKRLGVQPETVLASYLAGVVERFAENPFDSLTGPVARHDALTVAANMKALETEPRLQELYRAFLASAWSDYDAGC